MKPKNKKKNLEIRQNAWKNNSVIQKANSMHPGSYKKPGSQTK